MNKGEERRERMDAVKADADVQDWLKEKPPSVNYIAFCIEELFEAHREHQIEKGEVPEVEKGTCGHCLHFDGSKDDSLGQCRRHAPQPVSPLLMVIAEYLAEIGFATADNEDANWRMHETKSLQLWPMVSEGDRCGEYAHNAHPARTQAEHLTTDGAEPTANSAS